jgi:CBS domain containing-hemolysin-like protein
VLLLAALVLFVVTAAAEAGVIFVSRLRLRSMATKGRPGAASLAANLQDRRALLGALAIARNVAAVLSVALGTFLVLKETGVTWLALAATMGGALLTLALLDGLPRLLVARSPERWGLRLAPAMSAFRLVFGLPARALEVATYGIMRLRGRGDRSLSATEGDEDLLRLVQMGDGNGGMENGELAMVRRIAHMVDRAVREIMVPRIDMVAAEADATVDEVLDLVVKRGFSRIPLFEETIDNVVGVVYAKDILKYLADGRRPASMRDVARPPYFIPEGKHVDELLAELREHRVHMAIVVDEYGGTAGLATIEDVLEEIVGEIQDEYDREEVTVERVSDTEAILDARVGLDALNEMFALEIQGEDFDTLGGFVYHELGRMPAPGDEVHTDGLTLRVLSVLGRRIKKVRVTKTAESAEGGEGAQEAE